MKIRSVAALSRSDLQTLSTERLLAYLKKLNQCENSLQESDWSLEQIAEVEGIIFKSSIEWEDQVKLVKAVLSNRPHIE